MTNSNLRTENHFDYVKISIASPQRIMDWGQRTLPNGQVVGEVTKPETINYRTLKPEMDGLFCEKIFGPSKDWECHCGKYKRVRHRGIVCERCGVEVTESRVRRHRMGYIKLAAPVSHVWYLKGIPSYVAILLDIPLRDVEQIVYFNCYVVLDPGDHKELKYKQLLTEDEWLEIEDEIYAEDSTIENEPFVGIGAEALKQLLEDLDLNQVAEELREEITQSKGQKRAKLIKRIRVIDNFIATNAKPEWMVLDAIPVIPPDLRPMVQLDGGRFATSDLNDLYRRVINRNNRLARLQEILAPEIIVRNEKRMLQEAVDALIDNGRRGRTVVGANNRALKSLSDIIEGKQGRFRQNLLGKRVDYSGRSVIVVGPKLKMHQCGLPKEMAIELFQPFVIHRLIRQNIVNNIKAAKKLIQKADDEVMQVLQEVIEGHPILLNRAPTLHRLGIQAFEPKLVGGRAIQLHPLVCPAFNADFDGDQMAVHIPLSLEAQLEARVLMMSTNNILSPSSGKPIIVPSQDIVLGIYYLSLINDNEEVKKYFSHVGEVEFALENKSINLHTPILFRTKTFNKETNEYEDKKFTTSPGRVLLFKTVPQSENLPFDCINKILTKKEISNLLDNVYRFTGQKATCIFVDQIMNVGFKYAAKAGISFGKDDLVIPEEKNSLIQETQKQVNSLEAQYQEGLITEREKYNKVVGLWSTCTDKVAKAMMKTVSTTKDNQINSVYIMAHSGARGSEAQLKQLAGMRGLMARPSGEIIENPITSNFKDGLTVLEYFNSTHGARKGLADTALKTASSGYLTRRLVDVAQDLTITQKDCSCSNGLTVDTVYESGEVAIPLKDRVFGRYLADDVKTSEGKVIMKNGEYISHEEIETIEKENITSVRIKSPITCGCVNGICAKAYGRDLAKGEPVNTGEAVGIIAAQSIGEPGTQLTMRTFHVGGVASSSAEKSNFESPSDGKIKIQNLRSVVNQAGSEIIINRTTELEIYDLNNKLVSTFRAPYGSTLLVKDKAEVKLNDLLLEWDPYTVPIVAEESGTLDFSDLVEGVSFIEKFDETTGISSKVIIDWKSFQGKQDLKPQLVITDDKGNPVKSKGSNNSSYDLSVGIVLNIEKGKEVKAGDIIARIPRASSKTKDITGGLPRVADIFESRKPKNPAVLAEVSGVIEFGKDIKSKRRIIINPENGDPVEYLIPKGTYIYFNEGDKVNKGDMIVDGTPAPTDILNILGIEALAEYMVREVQKVYRLQGVLIDDKHIECITRQMLQKVEVIESGDSEYLVGDVLDRTTVLEKNIELKEAGKNEVKFKMMILGITKASLQTNSFISAASFQETTRVLTEAAINGKVDKLTGLKENVIVGKLIPAGTGNVIRALRKEAKIRDNSLLKQIENTK